MATVKINKLLNKVDSKYTLVILAAKRARQITDYLSKIKRHEILDIKAPQLTSISKKPLIAALEEISEGKVTYERLPEAK